MADDDNFKPIFTAIVFIVMPVCFALGVAPGFVLVFGAMVVLWLAGIISTEEALGGYSNSGLLTIAFLFIVVQSASKRPVLKKAGGLVFGKTVNVKLNILRMMTIVFLLSGILANTPLVSFILPVIKEWCAANGAKPTKFFMPLSFAAVMGGLTTMIGASVNLIVQSFLIERHEETFGFFDPAALAFPLGFIGIVFMSTIGGKLLPEETGKKPEGFDEKPAYYVSELTLLGNSKLIGKNVLDTLQNVVSKRAIPLQLQRLRHVERAMQVEVERTPEYGSRAEQLIEGSKNVFKVMKHDEADLQELMEEDLEDVAQYGNYGKAARRWGERIRKAVSALRPDHANQKKSVIRRRFMKELQSLEKSGEYETVEPVPADAMLQAGDRLTFAFTEEEEIISAHADVDDGVVFGPLSEATVAGKYTHFFEVAVSDRNPFTQRMATGATISGFYNGALIAVRHVSVDNVSATAMAEDVERMHMVSSGKQYSTPASKTARTPALNDQEDEVDPENSEGDMVGLRHRADPGSSASPDEIELKIMSSAPSSPDVNGDRALTSGNTSIVVDDAASIRRTRLSEEINLRTGDSLLILANNGFVKKWHKKHHFFSINRMGEKPRSTRLFDFGGMLVFLAMIIVVTIDAMPTVKAAALAAVLVVAGGWVTPDEALESVDWGVVIMIGGALGLGNAMFESGLTQRISDAIADAAAGNGQLLVMLTYMVSMILAEIVTNNAAAALAMPIAIGLAHRLGSSVKPFAAAVLFGSSCGFATPTGYQTHMIVSRPAGYKFTDFLKVGATLDIIYWGVCSALLPVLWPLNQTVQGAT